jgi:Asp-tRNA(Asn)/Glu-tRNA(Gln) amidotransferase A subunit family amidase
LPEAPARPRIALCRTPWWEAAEPASRAALEEAAERLRAAGAEVFERELPAGFAGLGDAGMTILVHEARQAFGHELRTAADRVSAGLRELLARDDPDPAPYDAARRVAEECRALVASALFAGADALLTPSAPGEAPLGLGSTGSPVFNHPWTLLHVPCVSLPGLSGPSGMPVGVQLVGPRGGDAALLALAAGAERALAGAAAGRPGS